LMARPSHRQGKQYRQFRSASPGRIRRAVWGSSRYLLIASRAAYRRMGSGPREQTCSSAQGHVCGSGRLHHDTLLRTRPRAIPEDGQGTVKMVVDVQSAHAVPSFLTLYMACTPCTASTPHAAWVIDTFASGCGWGSSSQGHVQSQERPAAATLMRMLVRLPAPKAHRRRPPHRTEQDHPRPRPGPPA
jgi:hypothetical protein